MKIAWFTPLARDSAVGRFSVAVTDELAREHDVELWVPERSGRLLPTDLPTVRFRRRPAALVRLSQFDATVYSVGNHVAHHAAILDIARVYPGYVVLHDVVLHPLYYVLAKTGELSQAEYLDALGFHYGETARVRALHALVGRELPAFADDELAVRQPLFEPALVGARGVVAHSRFQAELVRSAWVGPLCVLFQPHAPAPAPTPRRPRRDEERLTLLSIGWVNANKRIDHVIEVLGRRPDLAARVRFQIAGSLASNRPYVAALRSRVAELGLGRTVDFLDFVAERELATLLANADIHVNLRYPPFEGSSASLARQLVQGRPVIVYDVGAYAELPDDSVVRIPPGDLDALESALASLLAQPQLRDRVGGAGARYAASLTTQRYASELAGFLAATPKLEPLIALADRAGAHLAHLGIDSSASVIAHVRDEIAGWLP